MPVSIYHVDAFADYPFAGNPAAVCLLHGPVDEEWMQNIAAEINLSETAFIYPLSSGYSLRWFTPVTEVDLCGHATLAGTHILAETGILDEGEEAVFHTRSGILAARRMNGWIEMNFPSFPVHQIDTPAGFSEALGVEPVYAGEYEWMILAEVESEDDVRSLQPDFSALKKIAYGGVIVTAKSSDARLDFISRFFAPSLGIDEDPVTGSAHCCLGPYWRDRLGRNVFTAYQASSRGGVISLRLDEDRIYLSGQAVTVMSGVIL